MPRNTSAALNRLLPVIALVTALGCVQQNDAPTAGSQSSTGSEPQAEETSGSPSEGEFIPVVFSKPTTIEFTVPEMMCPHGCYPGVKEALADQPNVVSIELGTPSEEKANTINDRRVIITTEGEFDATAAVSDFPAHLQEGVEVQELTGEEDASESESANVGEDA